MRPDKNAEYHKISESDWDGIWYPADGGKEKIMIVVSGSDGGLEHAGKHAHFLADNGVPALAILVCPVMEVHQHQLGPGAQL